jgi:hypothetical protein
MKISKPKFEQSNKGSKIFSFFILDQYSSKKLDDTLVFKKERFNI